MKDIQSLNDDDIIFWAQEMIPEPKYNEYGEPYHTYGQLCKVLVDSVRWALSYKWIFDVCELPYPQYLDKAEIDKLKKEVTEDFVNKTKEDIQRLFDLADKR